MGYSIRYDPQTGEASVTLTDKEANLIFSEHKTLIDVLRDLLPSSRKHGRKR